MLSYRACDEQNLTTKVKPAFEAAIRKMESLGAILCDPVEIATFEEWKTRVKTDYFTVILTDFKEDLAKYLSGMKSTDVHNLQDIIE
ncbi:hypothetical protein QFC19_004612 [Naganishia cerealis]|uniref:Uncharacterized protein n=1 Tax=Naganishia cerealis TaxID=610337 RepID=A0ACC2VVH0_9TREE|nr:hypothetical protein QFC19_004612 [Naganishia cerealis]